MNKRVLKHASPRVIKVPLGLSGLLDPLLLSLCLGKGPLPNVLFEEHYQERADVVRWRFLGALRE